MLLSEVGRGLLIKQEISRYQIQHQRPRRATQCLIRRVGRGTVWSQSSGGESSNTDTGPGNQEGYWELLGSHAAEIHVAIILEENFLILLHPRHFLLDRIPPCTLFPQKNPSAELCCSVENLSPHSHELCLKITSIPTFLVQFPTL